MISTLLPAIIGFLTAVLGTVLSNWFIERRSHREFAEKYRNALFEKQLAAYERLWCVLLPTSRHSTGSTVFQHVSGNTYFSQPAAQAFCDSLTDFFFSEHGLYLSKTTRSMLFKVRDALTGVLYNKTGGEALLLLDDATRKALRDTFRELVTTVREDVGLRALKFRPEDIGVDEEMLEK